jgi:hypothetical protein
MTGSVAGAGPRGSARTEDTAVNGRQQGQRLGALKGGRHSGDWERCRGVACGLGKGSRHSGDYSAAGEESRGSARAVETWSAAAKAVEKDVTGNIVNAVPTDATWAGGRHGVLRSSAGAVYGGSVAKAVNTAVPAGARQDCTRGCQTRPWRGSAA